MKSQDPQMPNPSDGVTRDGRDLPNKGTGTGFIPGKGTFADTGADALNRTKGISGSTGGDPQEKCYGYEQQRGNEPGMRSPDQPAEGFSADSDPMYADRPKDQRF